MPANLGISTTTCVEAAHFVECIEQGGKPLTDGESGLRVVKILEAATKSMKGRGRIVEI